MTVSKRPDDHVVVDFAGRRPELVVEPENQLVLRCLHCGDKYILPLPVSLMMSALVMRQYGKEHRRCRERKP